jgi:hypothetical protein
MGSSEASLYVIARLRFANDLSLKLALRLMEKGSELPDALLDSWCISVCRFSNLSGEADVSSTPSCCIRSCLSA